MSQTNPGGFRRYRYFEFIETHAGLLGVLIAIAVSFGGLAEIIPLFFQAHVVKALPGVEPRDPLRLVGFDVYVREGCYGCHSQMIRTLRAETERYGHYSEAGESVYDHPHQWGSKRTGPDLARVGGKYSDDWHRQHLINPRSVPGGKDSNMPGYPWLDNNALDVADVQARMKVLRTLGTPYSDADIAAAPQVLKGKTEMDALVAYLQSLGTALPASGVRTASTQAAEVAP
ncbi:cytochrome-c oxidase, cbb3-type subunit II [Dyella koreensis]|uniref:Cytochrome-c oxidase, cbb3-type subunit II n=1 Tax=Dyella koreensis TaxID=311235 RepID=A0ABW8KC00_9GAMM